MKVLRIKQLKIFILAQALALCAFTCSDESPTGYDTPYVYTVPTQTNDGWETAALTDVGIDETPISQFMNELLNTIDHRIHGILIIKNSRLVLEEYFSGYQFYHGPFSQFNRETRHNLASVTKSFTSALTGLAIDHGFIAGVNQKVFSFFPEYSELNNQQKDRITLKHLLTMTAGLQWDESSIPYTDPRNDIAQLFQQDDPIRFILSKPVTTEPGVHFLYNGGCTNVIGEIIRKTSGLTVDDFSATYLFTPLGISDYQWQELPHEVIYTSGDLRLRPRDMAKLGAVYLNGGLWKDQLIISKEWIEVSTKPFIHATPELEYGFQWWVYNFEFDSVPLKSFSARGWGGQNIIVFPDLDLVVITTAGYYDEPGLEYHINGLLIPAILSAVL